MLMWEVVIRPAVTVEESLIELVDEFLNIFCWLRKRGRRSASGCHGNVMCFYE